MRQFLLLAFAGAVSAWASGAHAGQEGAERISILSFDTRSVGMFGWARNYGDQDDARIAAIASCEANGGEQCIQGLVYRQYGAVAEMMLGRERGNALGWAGAATLEEAMRLALRQCDSFARNIGITRTYKDDPETLAKLPEARCAIIYFDNADWDEPVVHIRGQRVTGVGDYVRPTIDNPLPAQSPN